MARPLRSSLALAPLILHLACGRDYIIIDNWGPPGGYGAVQGTMRDRSGAAAPATHIAITRCATPIGGSLGEATSDQQGAYRVDGHLPPGGGVWPQPTLDTLRVRCDVLLGPRGAAVLVDTVTVSFAASRESVVPIARDFVLP